VHAHIHESSQSPSARVPTPVYQEKKQLNNLVNVAGEPRARITIVEDVAAGKVIAGIILLAATMKKDLRSI
jgi:hypothetical protein